MTLEELNPYSLRNLRPTIENRIAEEASHHLIVHPEGDMVQRHLSVDSMFCRSAVSMGYLTQQQMNHAALRYRLGMSRDGGVIFWQIDQLELVCDGKIMYYRPDCHRDKQRKPTWVSSEMKRFYLADQPDVAAEVQPPHCLFGIHLLNNVKMQKCKNVKIAVVESEKTAVIMSEHHPDYLWLASGGLTELTAIKLFPLRGHKIILFPDTDTNLTAYSTWYRVAQEASRLLGQPVTICPILELRATPAHKRRKIDILDYYFENIRPLTSHH